MPNNVAAPPDPYKLFLKYLIRMRIKWYGSRSLTRTVRYGMSWKFLIKQHFMHRLYKYEYIVKIWRLISNYDSKISITAGSFYYNIYFIVQEWMQHGTGFVIIRINKSS